MNGINVFYFAFRENEKAGAIGTDLKSRIITMKTNRIELEWGKGELSLLVNLKKGEIISYGRDDQKNIHGKFGGKCYYQSRRSGATGAGWVPSTPALKSIAGYRVDKGCWFPTRGENEGSMDYLIKKGTFHLFGVPLFAPFDYVGKRVADEYPVVGYATHCDQFYFISLDVFPEVLSSDNGWEMRKREEIEISYFKNGVGTQEKKTYVVYTWGNPRKDAVRKVLEAFYIDELIFQGGIKPSSAADFWRPLGLRPAAGTLDLFKVTANIARARYTREQLSTLEFLASIAPRNIVFLGTQNPRRTGGTPMYLQETKGDYGLVYSVFALFSIEGEEYAASMIIQNPYALMQGKGLDELEAKLRVIAEHRKTEEETPQEDSRLNEDLGLGISDIDFPVVPPVAQPGCSWK